MINTIKLLIHLLLLGTTVIYSQQAEWTNYANTSRITSLMKDGEDMWIGTTGGLIKMNILTGDKILYNKATEHYPGNYVTSIKKTPEGVIWIGTKDGGIGKFEGENWESINTDNSILPVDYINCLEYGFDQKIWASAWGGGLIKVNSSYSLIVYNTSNSILPSNYINSFIINERGENFLIGVLNYDYFWFDGVRGASLHNGPYNFNICSFLIDQECFELANEGYYSQYNLDNSNDHLFLTLPDPVYINCISADSANVKWLGTRGKGIYVLQPDTSWLVLDTANSGLPGNDVRAIEAEQAEEWIGTLDGGLAKYDGISWRPVNTNTSAPFQGGVKCIYVDENNNKWIGFESDGIWKYNGNSEWSNINSLNSGLSDNYVTSLLKDNQGNYWAGTYKGGINKYDGSQWINFNPLNSGLSDTNIISIASDSDNNLWIATWGGGLNKYDGSSWEVYNTSNSGIADNYILSMCIDASGNIWLGTYGNGLIKYNGEDWEVYNTINSGIPSDYISALAPDKNNNLWIGTWFDGLAEYDNFSFKIFNSSNTSLPVDNISCISVDDSNNIYAGTRDAGIARFNANDTLTADWKLYSRYNSGLISNKINSIAEDKEGKTWIGSDDGVAVFNPAAAVGIKDETPSDKVESYTLSQNYPNPFNPSTTINYSIPRSGYVTLIVYDILGEEIAVLADEKKNQGSYSVVFNASNFPSGIYIYRLKVNEYQKSGKMIFLK